MSDKTEIYQILGDTLEAIFREMYGRRMGFALFVFPFSRPSLVDYISNGDRKAMIKTLRGAANRLEANQDIGGIKGHA